MNLSRLLAGSLLSLVLSFPAVAHEEIDLFTTLSGHAYFNIHTSEFGGGEIRGFLHQVPEPETYALMLLGLGVVGFAAKRRRH